MVGLGDPVGLEAESATAPSIEPDLRSGGVIESHTYHNHPQLKGSDAAQASPVPNASVSLDRVLFSHRLERSILDLPLSKEAFPPFFVDGRQRQATCSDVAWIGDRHLATVNLYGGHLRIYALVERDGVPTGLGLIQELNGIASPEGVAVSRNGSMLAVSHSLSYECGLTLFPVRGTSLELGPAKRLCAGRSGCAFHGVSFSPDGRYLAYTVIGDAPAIEIVELEGGRLATRLENKDSALVPKSIAFSADGRFAAIAYGLMAKSTDPQPTSGGMIAVHRFDTGIGKIGPNPIAEYRGRGTSLAFVEMATFLPPHAGETYRILVADQAADRIPAFSFNASAAILLPDKDFANDLSFPHGIDARADGRLVAIATYGDDNIHIARGDWVSSNEALLVPDGPHSLDPIVSKQRVAIVGHLAGKYLGGAERSLIDIVAAIDRARYHVTVILPEDDAEYMRSLRTRVDRVVVFPYGWRSVVPCDPKEVGRFEEEFSRHQIELVHVNTVTLLAPLLAAKRLGIATIVHARELLDRDAELASGLGGTAFKIAETLKLFSDVVIANSDATHRLYQKPRSSYRIYNCVDPDRFDFPNDIEPGKLKVGIIGHNSPRKGIDDFVKLAIASADRQPGLEFLVIGPPSDYTSYLEAAVHNESRPINVRFAGYFPNSPDALRLVNVVVSLPRIPESFGRTIGEGMASGRPVISYDKGAAAELIRHEQDGFLVRDGHVMEVLTHLETLLAFPSRVLEMGKSSRNRAKELFSPQRFAVELNEIYRHTLDSYGPAVRGLRRLDAALHSEMTA